MMRTLPFAAMLLLLNGCAYVGTVARQTYYRARLQLAPSPAIGKHLLDRQTGFVSDG